MAHEITKTLLAVVAFTSLCLAASAQAEQGIVGKWAKEDSAHIQVEFYQERDGTYWGKVINSDGKAAKNGHLLFRAVKYNADKKNYKGLLVPPNRGIEIGVTITLAGKDELVAVGKKLFMKKVFRFTRIG